MLITSPREKVISSPWYTYMYTHAHTHTHTPHTFTRQTSLKLRKKGLGRQHITVTQEKIKLILDFLFKGVCGHFWQCIGQLYIVTLLI